MDSANHEKVVELVKNFKNQYFELTGKAVIISQALRFNKYSLAFIDKTICKFLPKKYQHCKNLKETSKEGRKRQLVDLRNMFHKIAYDEGHTLVSIARHLDQDHTTVISGKNVCNDLIASNEDFKLLFCQILNQLEDDFRIDNPNLEERNYPQ